MAKSKKTKTPVNVQFADRYEGCQVVANIMGLNVETVRKRAKAGKIPARQDANGTWVFTHVDLVRAGIQPFAAGVLTLGNIVAVPIPGPLPLPAPKKVNVTEVIFVLDRSGSMSSLIAKARENLQAQLDQLRAASGPNDRYNVTVINFDDDILTTVQGRDVTNLIEGARSLYRDPSGSTKLYDAVIHAVATARTLDRGVNAFLISIVTDGAENASQHTVHTVRQEVFKATASDRYTFAYAGPRGSEHQAQAMGIPDGNTTTWEQSHAGITTLGVVSSTSLGTYTNSRSVGTMRSTSFYAQPVTTDPAKFAAQLGQLPQLDNKLLKVERVGSGDPTAISKFCDKKFGGFAKGKAHYELTESEKVQDYKGVIIQDKTTGNFYQGWDAAKKLLGIPDFQGTVQIKPGNLGDFKVFVQSTSTNRKLVPGTAVVYLP